MRETIYVVTCRTCGGKTEEIEVGEEVLHVVQNYDIWRLFRLVASKLRWCDCAAQAYEVDMRAEAGE